MSFFVLARINNAPYPDYSDPESRPCTRATLPSRLGERLGLLHYLQRSQLISPNSISPNFKSPKPYSYS